MSYWRSLRRRLRSHPMVYRSIVGAYSGYMRFVFRTTRWRFENYEPWIASLEAGQPFLITHWHGRLAIMPYAWDWKKWNLTVITTEQAVARVMADSAARMGIEAVHLKKGDANTRVLRQAVAASRKGRCLGMAVDGPSGPALVVKPGIVELASLTRMRIAPCSFSVTRGRNLGTWDSFLLPLPFGRGVIAMGDPVEVPRPLTPEATEQVMADLTDSLNVLDQLCDEACGR